MRFTYEEAELINGFIGETVPVPSRSEVLDLLVSSKSENEDPELTSIVSSTVLKLQSIDDAIYSKIVAALPVDTYTLY